MKPVGDILAGLNIPKQVAPARGPECSVCDDTGWQPVTGGVIKCVACIERRRGFAPGVPEDEQKTSLASYEQGDFQITLANKTAIEHAKYFLMDVHPGLYIHGGVGTGKTTLACAILNDLHRAGKAVRFVRVTELMKSVVQADTGDEAYQRLVAVPILCLDDIGAQKGSDYARQTILAVYEARTDRGHRTNWTSNLNLDELTTMFGDDPRLASRIVGKCKVVELDGVDYRLKKARRGK